MLCSVLCFTVLADSRVDHHPHGDHGWYSKHIVDERGADHVDVTDAGEQGQSSEAPEQLTGPGQARLLVEQTNVGQPQTQ